MKEKGKGTWWTNGVDGEKVGDKQKIGTNKQVGDEQIEWGQTNRLKTKGQESWAKRKFWWAKPVSLRIGVQCTPVKYIFTFWEA